VWEAPAEPQHARSPVHQQLVEIWQALLGVAPIGIQENFFDLGGHSLLAVRMAHEVERATGLRMPLAWLFEDATIEGLVHRMARQADRTDGTAPVLNASGRKPPVFFLHGDWTGGGLYCRAIAERLGADQPLRLLRPHTEAEVAPGSSIEALAALQVESIRAAQPAGPYRLGGYCNGAVIAYEAARQLEAAGEHIALLFLVDPAMDGRFALVRRALRWGGRVLGSRPAAGLSRRASVLRRLRYYARGLERLVGMSWPERLSYAAGRLRRDSDRPAAPASAAASDPTAVFYRTAQSEYAAGHLGGNVDVVWAEEDRWSVADPTASWRHRTRGVRLHRVAAPHVAVVTSHVPELLRAALEGSG
jgi:thioesterase domain-containing protein